MSSTSPDNNSPSSNISDNNINNSINDNNVDINKQSEKLNESKKSKRNQEDNNTNDNDTDNDNNNNKQDNNDNKNEITEISKKRPFKSNLNESEEPVKKKKKSQWDLQDDATDNEISVIEKAKIFAQQQLNAKILQDSKNNETLNNEDDDIMKRRIYIGSLPFEGITEAHIRSYFSPFGPIVNITHRLNPNTGRSRGFCFVDYAYAEAAERAIQTMNGKTVFGRVIRVGRPQIGQGVVKPVQQLPFSTNVPPTIPGSRIYVGSINYDLTSNDIRSIFSACGNIISCHLMPNPDTGKHKGFGFVDFDSAESAQYAIKVMNGYLIGGRNIRVGPATSNGPTINTSIQNSSTSIINNSNNQQNKTTDIQSSIGKEEDLSISGNERYLIMQKLARGNTVCKTVKLKNMVIAEELNDDGLEDEIALECSKFGTVKRIILFTPNSESNEVIVYIIFDSIDSATNAIQGLDKRWFAKRCIIAEYALNPPPKVAKQIEEELQESK